MLAGDDLDLLAGLQAVIERHDAPIDLGTPAVVADLSVHAVGEVQRCGALGQIDGMAVGCEDVDAIGFDVDAQLIGQTANITQLFMPFEHLTQPGDLFLVVVRGALDVGALVTPVRANAQLGFFVHGLGADLHFQHLALRPEHRGVQRAVAVLLGVGDVVVELLGNVSPQGVHDTQRGVAIANLGHQHANGANVVDLTELQAFLLHLPPDRIDMLGTPVDFGVNPGGGQFVLELLDHVLDVLLAIQPALMQQLSDLLVLFRLKVAEGQVLQLPLDVTDAQAMGQRRVDVEDLASYAVPLVIIGILHGADGAGPLGQLDERDANVVDHRHQHLAQVFHLGLCAQHQRLARVEAVADGRHAQHTLDQLGHHRAEVLVHLGQLDLAFAHAAVDDGRDQAVLIKLEVGEYLGDFQPNLVTGGAFTPEVLCRVRLLLRRSGELAGLLECVAVECRVHPQHMIEPAIEVDAAVGVDRLKRSDLDHLIPSLYASSASNTPAFSEPVG